MMGDPGGGSGNAPISLLGALRKTRPLPTLPISEMKALHPRDESPPGRLRQNIVPRFP